MRHFKYDSPNRQSAVPHHEQAAGYSFSEANDMDIKRCKCGEPEMVGIPGVPADFGWFTTDEGTFCQRCGRKQGVTKARWLDRAAKDLTGQVKS